MPEDMGTCQKHGEFVLRDGCPECISDQKEFDAPDNYGIKGGVELEEGNPTTRIVKVRYCSETTGYESDREYTYFAESQLQVGDIVMVPIKDRDAKAKVSAINVPESEIEAFRDKVKTISVPEQTVPKPSTEAVIVGEWQQESGKDIALLHIKPELNLKVIDLHNKALELNILAEQREIKVNDDLALATDGLALIRKLKKALEGLRKEYLDPLEQHKKDIRAAFDWLLAPVYNADKITSQKMLAFSAEQDRKRAEAQSIAREQAELAERAKQLTGEIIETAPVPVVEEAPKRVITDSGMESRNKTHWTWELIDKALVPEIYKKLDYGAISSAVKGSKGTITIPGIRIFNNPTLEIRTEG